MTAVFFRAKFANAPRGQGEYDLHWLDESTGTYRGRPVDVAVAKDGSLLVSDDYAGAIYRISYSGQ